MFGEGHKSSHQLTSVLQTEVHLAGISVRIDSPILLPIWNNARQVEPSKGAELTRVLKQLCRKTEWSIALAGAYSRRLPTFVVLLNPNLLQATLEVAEYLRSTCCIHVLKKYLINFVFTYIKSTMLVKSAIFDFLAYALSTSLIIFCQQSVHPFTLPFTLVSY